MTVHRRTEITVETECVLIIRQHRSVRVWNEECACPVDMVALCKQRRKPMMKRIREILIAGLSVAVFVLLISSSPALAQSNAGPNPQTNSPWTTVGAAGTVDPASTGLVVYGNPLGTAEDAGAIALGRFFMPQTVTIRYNVVSVPGILTQNGVSLGARYLQQSADERVVVTLKQYSFATGNITNLLQIDSNNLGNPSASFQLQYSTSPPSASPTICNLVPPSNGLAVATLDFIHNSYYIEATLTKPLTITRIGATPVNPTALGMVIIFDPSVISPTCNPGAPIAGQ